MKITEMDCGKADQWSNRFLICIRCRLLRRLQAAIAANVSNIQLYSMNNTLAQQWKAVKYNPRIHWGRGWILFVCPWWVKPDAYDIHWGGRH